MSTKEEKRLMRIGYGIGVAFIIASAIVLSPCVRAKNVPYGDSDAVVEEFTAEPSGTPKTGQIREDTASLMPCEDPKAFQEWLETYEQETSEESETATNEILSNGEETGESDVESVPSEMGIEVETEAESRTVYTVNGETLNPDIQAYLYQRLSDYQLEWFMPYAIMIAYQESKFDQYNVSDDGLDYGLLQFRKQFWDWSRGDIFDPYAQIDVFVELMANRANAGCDLYEMISRHMMSDYGSYNDDYVSTVLSHERGLSIVE